MGKIGASFLFTGEVLGQRPMSQHRNALNIIDRDSGLKGYILRPLSAEHFEPTIPECTGLVDRSKLLGISGRSRKAQISLAVQKGIKDYPCPAGGCLLTDRNFSEKMRDYFTFTENPSIRDIALLKIGRHFRLNNGDKIIVARNHHECKTLGNLTPSEDHFLIPQNFVGPSVFLSGTSLDSAIEKMLRYTTKPIKEKAQITHFYDGKKETISV